MPREQINHPRPRSEEEPSITGKPTYARRGTAGTSCEPTVHVSWLAHPQTGGWVQVAFEADSNYFEFVMQNPDAEDGRTTAYSPVLTRHEINRMIRALRRARDQAYGKDE